MKSRFGYGKSRRYQMLVKKEAPGSGGFFYVKNYFFKAKPIKKRRLITGYRMLGQLTANSGRNVRFFVCGCYCDIHHSYIEINCKSIVYYLYLFTYNNA